MDSDNKKKKKRPNKSGLKRREFLGLTSAAVPLGVGSLFISSLQPKKSDATVWGCSLGLVQNLCGGLFSANSCTGGTTNSCTSLTSSKAPGNVCYASGNTCSTDGKTDGNVCYSSLAGVNGNECVGQNANTCSNDSGTSTFVGNECSIGLSAAAGNACHTTTVSPANGCTTTTNKIGNKCQGLATAIGNECRFLKNANTCSSSIANNCQISAGNANKCYAVSTGGYANKCYSASGSADSA